LIRPNLDQSSQSLPGAIPTDPTSTRRYADPVADADEAVQQTDEERPSTEAVCGCYSWLSRRSQRRRGRVMTVAMAICFAVSIPLYLVIGQLAFVLWAVVPIGTSLILRRLRPATAARAWATVV